MVEELAEAVRWGFKEVKQGRQHEQEQHEHLCEE